MDSLHPNALPLPVRLLNAAGGGLRRLGVPVVRLDAGQLIDKARRNVGETDFGGESFRDGLEVLVRALEDEADLTTLGRITVRADLLGLLENRLRIVALRRAHPEITEERIERPVFIVGMARTGTSILHELLSRDPALRTPLTWELDMPFPAPERATYDTDARIATVDERLAGIDKLMPDFKQMHPMGATLPQECVRTNAYEFKSMIFSTAYKVPSYARWLRDDADMRAAYRWHRTMLQHLQWRCPGSPWVLKSPGHLWALDALLGEYPDARLIQTHRDPLRILSSLGSLVPTLRSITSSSVDAKAVGEEWLEQVAEGLDASAAVRERGRIAPEQVLDLHFSDLMADMFAGIAKLYEWLEIEFSEEAEQRMRTFLAAHSREKRGRHRHRFTDTGLDPAAARERFARYQSYFTVPDEPED